MLTATLEDMHAATPTDHLWRRLIRSGRIVFGGGILLAVMLASVASLIWTNRPASPWYFDRQNDQLARVGPQATPVGFFGYDQLGRSMLARCLMGGAASLGIGLAAAAISVGLGVSVGLLAGYRGGWVDSLLMRIVDVMYGLPYILLVILAKIGFEPPLTALFRSGQVANFVVLFLAIGMVSWLTMARVVRGQVLSLRSQPFVEACRAAGLPQWRIFTHHLLPNLIGPITVYATLIVPSAILNESFLSFLGIGIQPPVPTWGSLASDGLLPALNPITHRWWMLVFPCILLAVTLLCLNFVGDGLRDVFDPQARGRQGLTAFRRRRSLVLSFRPHVPGGTGMRDFLVAVSILVFIGSALAQSTRPTTAPTTRPEPTLKQYMAMTEDQAFAEGKQMLCDGHQFDLLDLVETRIKRRPREVKTMFLAATLSRSTFYKDEAEERFRIVREESGDTPYDRCAAIVVALDHRQTPTRNFELLERLITGNPDQPLFLWLSAIEGREYDLNAWGVGQYEKLAKIWKPGPVLMHQTWANLLQELGRNQEELVHRKIAIKMCPQGWSYDGYADCLSALKRYAEADAAHRIALRYAPDDSMYMTNWAINDYDQGKLEGAKKKLEKAMAMRYPWWGAFDQYAQVLEKQQKPDEAIKYYEKAFERNPSAWWVYESAERLLRKLGRIKEADDVHRREQAQRKISQASRPQMVLIHRAAAAAHRHPTTTRLHFYHFPTTRPQ